MAADLASGSDLASTSCGQGDPLGRTPVGLLLDFGSVISISVFERHAQTEAILGLAPGSLGWLGPIAPETDPLWRSMQAGEITERGYWAQRARELGQALGEPDWDMRRMLARIRQQDPNAVVRPQMKVLIRQARARGIKVGILSNELELFYGEAFVRGIDLLADVDVIVDATHTGILKPDPRAYAMAIDAMHLPAERILFVDDQFRNFSGGVAAGLQTHLFDLRDVAGQMACIAARLRIQPSFVEP